MELFEVNSPVDLVLRGVPSETILELTGVDVGRNYQKLRDVPAGIDRLEYQRQHIMFRVGPLRFAELLTEYGEGHFTKGQLFAACGISARSRLSVRTLSQIMGCEQIYQQAYKRQRALAHERASATLQARYGCSDAAHVPGALEKRRATCVARYGVDAPIKLPEIAQKIRDTMRARYGAETTLQSPELAAKHRNTMIMRYGAPSMRQCPVLAEKARATCQARHGVAYGSQSPEAKAKLRTAVHTRYGADNPMLSEAVNTRLQQILSNKTGTVTMSEPEALLYARLVELYGESEVLTQYDQDSRYPFPCSFYIRPQDLFIELYGDWTHGGHWYGASELDGVVLGGFQARSRQQYETFQSVWTDLDVRKRDAARKNSLNYITFWGDRLQDSALWFAMGCPDGHDWDFMYSWLPARDLIYDGVWPAELKLHGRSISAAARMANWREFYKRELALWSLNYDNKWGTVQARLYSNRLKYIGKLPGDLTNREILRGLNIAGMVRAYSHFDNEGMVTLLQDYQIKSLYDPCAGWGERMLTCMAAGVQYTGTDISQASIDAHMHLLCKYREYASYGAYVTLGDSSTRDMSASSHDAVFTCPPYGDREIYTAAGAENLGPGAFLDWWRQVVEHSFSPATRVFAYQIDQVWKDRMNQVLLDLHWKLDRQIPVGRNLVSHMTRSRGDGTKHNFEEVQVFVR